MKKNQFTKLLQNKTVLAALLIVLMAGTAVAGITAMQSRDPEEDTEDSQPGYAFQTQEETEQHQEQLEVPSEPSDDGNLLQQLDQDLEDGVSDHPVQSGDVDAVMPGPDGEGGIGSDDTVLSDPGTLVDAGNAVIYEPETEAKPAGAKGAALEFHEGNHIAWPVEGNVVLDYSMDSTIYFPTLEQYKCNPGILIQSEVGTPVEAAVRGQVTAVGSDEELGNFVMMDLGGDYSILYGQLQDVTVSVDQVVEAGEVLGYVAEPTKYYVVEGPNMYLEMRYQGNPVDPLDYIR